MKKLMLALLMLVGCMNTEAKVVKISFADGTVKVYTTSQLSAIDFNDDGTIVVTTYDGEQIASTDAVMDILEMNDEPTIVEMFRDSLRFDVDADGVSLDLPTDRYIRKINYVYPSEDPWGEPIMLSGTMLIPNELWDGKKACEGIMMVHHYTKFNRNEAPTLSNGQLENILLANPLYPNYIIVESDFYGFGVTERFPQAFLQGLINARASLDGLLAARTLLDEAGFDYGPLCFNVGYSSAGYDALAAQKLRDMEYADRISFDKTFSGGGPSDVREAYRQYVLIDSTAYNAVPLLLMVTTNEIQRLGIDYSEVFQPYISHRIDELILSKNYSSWPVCDSIGREKKIHEILMPNYCDLSSEESMLMQDYFKKFSMTTDDGWQPDPSQRIYLFHSRSDDYVPIQSARPMVKFLKKKGLKPSIIPGKTNFQTNFLVTGMGHLSATLIYYVQTLAAIKAWPMMYKDNKLNPLYQAIVSKEVDIVGTMRQLDAMGFDCKTFINYAMEAIFSSSGSEEESSIDLIEIMMAINTALGKMNLEMEDVLEMSEDSGIDLMGFLFDLIIYLNEDSDSDEAAADNGVEVRENREAKVAQRIQALKASSKTPRDYYEEELTEWLKANGIESLE